MTEDIEFGEVEEERPKVMRRPDENRHFAVATCGAPREHDLRIYVDLDTMLDMELHAESNTNVELGGVMLGGQYVDHEGREFVVVTDCLRADHFEATKGSFKFTHDTWSDISRRLEEFPDDLRMVGWYHTHPDWGVFLSGMDLFICENFFNKPLDLALVIDPCRGDRGWFQWVRQRQGPQRTGGFYLTSSRFREGELAHVAQMLEGSETMPVATRSGSQMSGGYGAPVVNVVQDRGSQWTQIAVLGSLALQTVLVALLAWAVIGTRSGTSDELVEKLREEKLQLDARRDALADLAMRMGDVDKDFVKDLEQSEIKRRSLETSLASVTRTQRQADEEVARLKKSDKEWKEYAEKVEEKKSELEEDIKNLKAELAAAKNSKEGQPGSGFDYKSPWVWAVAVGLLALLVLGAVMFRSPRPESDDFAPADSDEGPPQRQNESKDSPGQANTT